MPGTIESRRKEFAERLLCEIAADRSAVAGVRANLREVAAEPNTSAMAASTRSWAESQGLDVIETCCFSCNTACEVLVFKRRSDGRIVKIEGDPASPVTKGFACAKGLAAFDLLYNPQRLTKPLKRIGGRAATGQKPEWKEISWDEALGEIAARLLETRAAHGPESVAFLEGTRRGWSRVYTRLANAFGTPHHGAAGWAQCLWPRLVDCKVTFGAQFPEGCDYSSSNTILVWGANPAATWPLQGAEIMDAKARGATLIVIDPRLSETASKADMWLRIKPGADTDLALGMIAEIIREKLWDKDFVDKWTVGFDKLITEVAWRTPAVTETLTGIPAAQMCQAAHSFAACGPSSLFRCVTVDQTADSVQTCRALSILSAITGNVDIKGGNVAVSSRGEISQNTHEFILAETIPEKVRKQRIGYDEFPLLCGSLSPVPSAHMPSFWRSVESGKPNKIKTALIFGSNAAVSYTNTKAVRRGIENFDFLAVCDMFMTPTAEMADIVLPASSWLERDNVISSFQTALEYTVLQRKCTEIGDSRSDVQIICELAQRLGLGDLFWKEPEALYDYLLSPTGLSFRQALEKRRLYAPLRYGIHTKGGFKTPSGKVEIWSSLLEANGCEPLPIGSPNPTDIAANAAAAPTESANVALWPFSFTTGARSLFFRHTENRRNPWLRARCPDPLVYINTETGKKLGLSDGDKVEVLTPTGSAVLVARLEPELAPDLVEAVPGWDQEANINLALGWEKFAQGIGTVPMRGLRCNIRKVLHE